MITKRREFLWLSAAGVAGLAASSLRAQTTPPKPDQIVVNASGGAMGSAMQDAYFGPFEAEHGIRVVETSPVDFGKLRAMVESGNIEWTVTELGGQDAVRASRMGLLEPLDDALLDRSHFPPEARDPYIFASSTYSTILGFNTEEFPDGSHPSGWAEFWDVERFPGPRSMRNHPVDNLEFALLADGVPKEELYPIDMDRAFRKLDEVRDHVTVWWTTGAQPAQLLLDGEVVLATGWNGRFFDLLKKQAPIGIDWTGGALKQGSFGIPKGAKDSYWGHMFLAIMADPKNQSVYANQLGYPGLNLQAIDYIDPEMAPFMPTYPEHLAKQFWVDMIWWDEHGAEAAERWNEWMLKG
jgi:putative spermidine/putrescine transport system substrate-binding protein